MNSVLDFTLKEISGNIRKIANNTKTDGTVNRGVKSRSAVFLPSPAINNEKITEILKTMQDDEVTKVARNDILILPFGEKLLKVGKEQHNRHFISHKMRELGDLY